MKLIKRILAGCIALTLMLSALPTITVNSGATSCTKVESKLDFTGMPTYGEGRNDAQTAQNKETVRQTLLAAGAVECKNLFLKGNMETIVNPGGYRGAGYYIQKVAAAEGETIQDATLNFGYWLCNSSTQGYIEVYVSADNVQYEKIYEQREGNGAAFTNTRREETVDLPFAEDQTEIYVKFVMEHWDTYEGAGIAYSTLTINASQGMPEDPGTSDKENTKIQNTYSFDELSSGEVTAEDIGAVEESNLYYGIDGVALLSPRNGYEEASATWLLETAEGEVLENCVLTIVGRTFYTNEDAKNGNYLKVFASTDGVSYTLVKDFRANDNSDDNQELTVDLTDAVKESEKAYVKLEWLVFDSPHSFGIRSVTLTGNEASSEEPEIPTEPETPVSKVESKLDFTGMPTYGEGRNDAQTAQNKETVRQTLLAAGAVECENLFLKGNMETIVNPGGYRGAGYYIQKVAAAEGDTIHDATLNFGYWLCNSSTQGYIEVYVSADNVQYEKIYEQREGNGAAFTNSRREETVDLPFAEDQTEIYVKFVMEHWDTYEGAGIAYSTLTINASQDMPEDPGTSDEEYTKVQNTYSFDALSFGEVTAEDIGAIEESNLYYGIDAVALLSPRNGYEEASATWLLEAAEGEVLENCVLTIVGRTFYTNEDAKNGNYLKVFASTDGVSYTLVKDFRANDNSDDNQELTVDLTDVVKGSEKAYVKLEWLVFDSPHSFGIRSVTLTGNAAGKDPSEEPENPTEPEAPSVDYTPVEKTHSFMELPYGEVTAQDIGAIEESNLYYGIDGVALLSPRNGYEEASATWLLEAAEGEILENCVLTIVGRTFYITESVKNDNYLKVFASADGVSYTLVKDFRANGNPDDNQELTVDLTDVVKGSEKAYVKLEWLVFDSPHIFGIRSVTLTGNADDEADVEVSDPSLDFGKAPEDCKLVKHTYNFEKLSNGEVSAKDIGAIYESNLYFGIDGVPLLSPRNGYEIASATWLLEAAEGEPLHNCLINIVGRTFYITESVKNDNYLKVYASVDGKNYTLVKDFRANSNPDFSQNFMVDLSDAVKGSGKAYIKLEWLVFDSPHIFGIRGITLVGNSIGKNVSFGIGGVGSGSKKPVDLSIPHEECMKVELSQNFNSLTAGEVTAEDLGAVDEMNMFFGIDGVPLLSPRNGYEIASATWKLETEGKDPLYDCVLTIVGRTFYVNESVKDDNYLKVYASADGVNYTLVKDFRANDNPDDTQRFTVDLTDVVKGNGQAYVKLEWLVFDSPHIFGIRSITLTGNTAGIDNSSGISAKVAITNIQNFSQLAVGPADKDALFAYKSANLCYGYNNIGLLTASEAGEDAYVTWELNSKAGEPFEDCYLTLIGRCGYINQEMAEKSEWRIQFSSDGENYSTVTTLKPTEPAGDLQSFVIDLSVQSFGLNKIYVRLYWKSQDDPSGMGLRAMSLVANAGEDYALFTPNVLSDKLTIDIRDADEPVDAPADPQQEKEGNNGLVWIIAGGTAAVAVIAATAVILLKKKRSRKKANKKDASI